MVQIKPEEISAILRQQLSNFNASTDLEEVGTVLQVGDGIARVYGLGNVRYGELVEFENGVRAIALNLEEDNVGVVLMERLVGYRKVQKFVVQDRSLLSKLVKEWLVVW
jgi:F-type H+-transporting ATPase subunit alpha